MAPPKTAVLSQQQQQQLGDLQVKQQQAAAKPRKRKAKQAQQSVQIQSSLVEQPKQQQNLQQVSKPVAASPAIDVQERSNSAKVVSVVSDEQQKQSASVVPSERTTLKKQQQQQPQEVPPQPVKEISVVSSKRVVATPEPATTVVAGTPPVSVIGKHQQISTEEADDVDAGIELDGSSNSGSSVKDMNEDQMKSTSVSPVMAQSNLVNESGASLNVKQQVTIAEVVPVDRSTKTMCSDASPVKKTTKQQLAANQQVIDADEQQLQEKLKNKQRKSSLSQGSSSSSSNTPSKDNNSQNGDKKSSIGQANSVDKSSGRMRRSLSSQSSQDDATLCKVCEQHVYQMERMLAEKSVYHKRCFRCHQCKIQLRIDNYSSHEGRPYCKAHHRQIFQPQMKLDKENDVDIVAKSTPQTVDDYLLHRGRLSELSFSFLNPKPEGILKRQMIICENEPAELPKDVVRSDTKVDDGIDQLNLNLNNILEKFERGTANNGEEDQPSSAGVVIEKPSFNIKQTLMAFESKLANTGSIVESNQGDSNKSDMVTERPIVKKLTNNNVFLNRQNSQDNEQSVAPVKPLVVRRSESLMMRLKKYESRIAGELVDEDNSDGDEDNGTNNNKDNNSISDLSRQLDGDEDHALFDDKKSTGRRAQRPKKLTSIDLSSLKNQWENGDILKRRNEEEENEVSRNSEAGDNKSPLAEKNEELIRIRQQLAQKKLGESGPIRNIYENAIKDAQLQQKQQASRRDSSDLSALNGFSTNIIQQQLLQNSLNGNNTNNNGQDIKTPTTPNKDHFQLNLNKKANKLKEKFELGLITNSSRDDSDISDGEEAPELTKLEQIRQEKLEDLSIFTDGQIKSREARNLFQQIDRRISAANGGSSQTKVVNSRSLASIGTPMRSKLANQVNVSNGDHNHYPQQQQHEQQQQPIRLTNNVRIQKMNEIV